MRGAKLYLKDDKGVESGPFRWTAVRDWVAGGYLTAEDQVRPADEASWHRIGTLAELLPSATAGGPTAVPTGPRGPGGEAQSVGPRALAYLKRLDCPIRPERLNPATALEWIRILEELHPSRTDPTENWAAGEEAHGRTPAASPHDATPDQVSRLRAAGIQVPADLTRLQARRLLSGPPTEGQLRRLKFFAIPLPEGACKEEAAELIDRHMRENWHSEEAYQASRRHLDEDGRKAPPALKLRLSAEQEAAEDLARSGAPPITVLNPPIPHAPPPPRPSRTIPLLALGVAALGFIFVGWYVMTRKPAAPAPPQSAALQSEPPLDDPVAIAAKIARAVTVLEAPTPAAGEQLQVAVVALPFTGIVGGPEPQAVIDGRLYRVGDGIDPVRGIVVVQIDAKQNSVTFSDASGSIVRRELK